MRGIRTGTQRPALIRRGGLADWDAFLDGVAAADPEAALRACDRAILAIDTRLPRGTSGIALEKKDERNPIRKRTPSVLRLVHDLSLPLPDPDLQDLSGFPDLVGRMSLLANDASPDTVTSAVMFAARQADVPVPESFWERWLPAVTAWEQTGNAASPERSWPALASALAHRHFGAPDERGLQPVEELAAAWKPVLRFFAEAVRAGYDPADVPADAPGTELAVARAALAEERARYRRRAIASDIHQLSLPMKDAPRRRLVDALFTRESEFAGALKVLARNDQDGSPLGEGFTLLLVEREPLRDLAPEYWITISVDPRSGVHLRDLWLELEQLEAEAWRLSGVERPPVREGSRQIAAVDRLGRVYHEPWYLDENETLVASPMRQAAADAEGTDTPGSRLSAEEVRRAVFRVYDPLARPLVHSSALTVGSRGGPARERLIEVEPLGIVTESGENTNKRVFTVWWPREEPMPHPAAMAPLPPSALRAMAARLSGIAGEDVYLDAPDLEDIETIPFGNGFAVVGDDGAFLVDCGRGGRPRIEAARALVERQAKLASALDEIQRDIQERSQQLADDLRNRGTTGEAIRRQGECAAINARLIDLRGKLDVPLETDEAGLQPLKNSLARRWNTRMRLGELVAEVESLDRSSRSAEELRVFRAGRWAAGLVLGLMCADALGGPVAEAIELDAVLGQVERAAVFVAIFILTVILTAILERWLRQAVRSR